MNQLLESIYADSTSEPSLEKTAEQAFLGGIDTPTASPENPFLDLSLDELVKLAHDLEVPAVEEPAESEVSEEELNKTAAAMFGGQLMAHAVVHELGLIKHAVANGVCRVCKENYMDIEGQSVCSACHGGSY